MRIDDQVEPLVREVLAASVKRDLYRLDIALSAFPEEQIRAAGLRLVLAICAQLLLDIHGGVRPTDEQIDALAIQTTQAEGWAKVEKTDVAALLRNISTGSRLDGGLATE